MLEEKDLQEVQKMIDTAEERITGKTKALIAESEERVTGKTKALIAESEERVTGKTKMLIAESEERMKTLIAESEERTAKRTVALMDLEFNKKFDILLEGQQALLEQMVPTTRVEALEDDVKVLKIAVRQLSEEVQKLKKAQ